MRLRHEGAHVVDVTPGDPLEVALHDGRDLAAAEVVLAIGQAALTIPPGAAAGVCHDRRHVGDRWREGVGHDSEERAGARPRYRPDRD
jgi:hypothetical protein